MEHQNIASAGKIDAGTSSHRQQPSQMEAFRGQAMLRAEFGEKRKRKEPIRSDQSATLFMHVPISSKLAHFLLKHSKQIHILEEENQEIRNCDVIRARFCDLGDFLRSIEFNFVTKFKLKVSIFHYFLFLFRSGASNLWPTSQNFFV